MIGAQGEHVGHGLGVEQQVGRELQPRSSAGAGLLRLTLERERSGRPRRPEGATGTLLPGRTCRRPCALHARRGLRGRSSPAVPCRRRRRRRPAGSERTGPRRSSRRRTGSRRRDSPKSMKSTRGFTRRGIRVVDHQQVARVRVGVEEAVDEDLFGVGPGDRRQDGAACRLPASEKPPP